MPSLQLGGPSEHLAGLAARFSYEDDEACTTAGASELARGYYTRSEFLVVCARKTKTSGLRVAANTAAIEVAQGEAPGRDFGPLQALPAVGMASLY